MQIHLARITFRALIPPTLHVLGGWGGGGLTLQRKHIMCTFTHLRGAHEANNSAKCCSAFQISCGYVIPGSAQLA